METQKKIIKNNILILFLVFFISSFFTFFLLGLEFINPKNTKWLINGDLSTYQLGWKYFRDDIWRFPLLSNPNYGIYRNSNIIYSDSIPILAIIFKLIRFILPENFQYFSAWIFLSINLQFYISFLIIKKFTNDNFFSLIGGLFFITACIFIHRSGIHLSLFGQWVILLYFLFHLDVNQNNQRKHKLYTILISILIHFYFTLILLILYLSEKIYFLLKKKNSILSEFFDVFKVLSFSLFLMYVVGYFSIGIDDGLGWGYGFYNFNLNSFFNPKGKILDEINWSNFLPMQNYNNKEIEGFAYLGLSGIIFFIIFLKYLFLNRNEIIYPKKLLILCTTIFFLISVSNNVNFGQFNIFEIGLNKYFYALGSIFRASGRFIWPVYYLIFLYGIILIYNYKNIRLILILLLFTLQILDISKGLSNYKFGKQYLSHKNLEPNDSNVEVWKKISKNFKVLKLLEPDNQSNIYGKLSKILLETHFVKTDVVYLARVDRERIVKQKYNNYKHIMNNKINLFDDSIYVSDNINLVNFLKLKFSRDLFYYKMNDLWLIVSEKIDFLNHKRDNEYLINSFIDLDNTNILKFDKNFDYALIGFEKDKVKNDLILDGEVGFLSINIVGNKCKKNTNLKIRFKEYYNDEDLIKDLVILVNDELVNLNKKEDYIFLNFNCRINQENSFKFIVNTSKSKFEKKIGLNHQKRSIKISSFDF